MGSSDEKAKGQNLKDEGLVYKSISTFNFRLFLLMILLAMALRIFLLFAYQPVSYSDTNSYRRSAIAVTGRFADYDGTRTPGYPSFLALFSPEQDGWEMRVWLAQMVLGVIITALMYYLGWQATGRNRVGVLMGLAYTLNFQQIFFECNLLTEALTTFFITLTIAGTAFWFCCLPQRLWALLGVALAIGLAAALAAITRPLFIFLPVWILPFITLKRKNRILSVDGYGGGRLNLDLRFVLTAIFPAILILGGWIAFIHNRYGNWSMTTMTGYHLIQHTGGYFEYVPDEYAALRDTYLQYRQAQITAHGTQTNAIWEAIPAMQKASGLGFYDLSDKLVEISIDLIRQHPFLFLRNAVKGWWMFWRAPIYWSAEALRWPSLVGPLHLLLFAERVVLFGCNLAFVGLSVGLFIWVGGQVMMRGLKFEKWKCCRLKVAGYYLNLQSSIFGFLLATTIWASSVLQALLDHGDNPRFLVPLQTFVILWLIVTLSLRAQGSKAKVEGRKFLCKFS